MLSNSLSLLMAKEEYKFDPGFAGYEKFFNYNILQGIYKYDSHVHALKDDKPSEDIQMILFRNIIIRDDGTVQIDVKPETKGIDNFEENYERLISTM